MAARRFDRLACSPSFVHPREKRRFASSPSSSSSSSLGRRGGPLRKHKLLTRRPARTYIDRHAGPVTAPMVAGPRRRSWGSIRRFPTSPTAPSRPSNPMPTGWRCRTMAGRHAAFDRRMPAFGDAMTDAELQRVLDYIRGFCARPCVAAWRAQHAAAARHREGIP